MSSTHTHTADLCRSERTAFKFATNLTKFFYQVFLYVSYPKTNEDGSVPSTVPADQNVSGLYPLDCPRLAWSFLSLPAFRSRLWFAVFSEETTKGFKVIKY
jgi:hypothetical protein